MLGRTFVPGEVRMFAGAPPDNDHWLPLNGQVIDRAPYPQLSAKLGTTWNVGGESASQMRLPDARGRVPVHQGTAQGGGVETGAPSRAVATKWGVNAVVLTPTQMPVHSHSVSGSTSVDPGHAHQFGGYNIPAAGPAHWQFVQGLNGSGLYTPWSSGGAFGDFTTTDAAGGHGHSFSGGSTNAGGGTSHDNTSPSFCIPFYIYTGEIVAEP
jgi:microcystin-dependent protein